MSLDDFLFNAIYWPWNLMDKMPRGPLRLVPFILGLLWIFPAMLFIGLPGMAIVIVREVCGYGD